MGDERGKIQSVESGIFTKTLNPDAVSEASAGPGISESHNKSFRADLPGVITLDANEKELISFRLAPGSWLLFALASLRGSDGEYVYCNAKMTLEVEPSDLPGKWETFAAAQGNVVKTQMWAKLVAHSTQTMSVTLSAVAVGALPCLLEDVLLSADPNP
jgi:hypothetical protein